MTKEVAINCIQFTFHHKTSNIRDWDGPRNQGHGCVAFDPETETSYKRRLSWRESAEKFAIYEVCELMDRKGNWIAAEGMWWKFTFLYHCSFTRLVAILSLDKLSRFRALRLLLTGLMLYRCEYIYILIHESKW